MVTIRLTRRVYPRKRRYSGLDTGHELTIYMQHHAGHHCSQDYLQRAACRTASCSYCHDPQPLPGVIANKSELVMRKNNNNFTGQRLLRRTNFHCIFTFFLILRTGSRWLGWYLFAGFNNRAAVTGRLDTEVDTLIYKIPTLATPSIWV